MFSTITKRKKKIKARRLPCAVAMDVRTPKYKMRVVKDKKKFIDKKRISKKELYKELD